MKKLFIFSVLAIAISFSYMAYHKISSGSGLTMEEIEWLKSRNGIITVSGDPYYPPLDFINDNGTRDGIAEEIISNIENDLDIKFKRVNYPSWPEAVNNIRSGTLDIIVCMAYSEQRARFLNFTPPYLEVPTVIVAHGSDNSIYTMKDLKGKKVAIPRDYGSYDYFRLKYPGLKIIPTDCDEDSLIKVSSGIADAAISDQPAVAYIIERKKLKDLSIRMETEYLWKYSIASRKEHPILNSILSKAVNSISEKQRNVIARKWFDYRSSKLFFSIRFWNSLLFITGIVFAAVSIFLFFAERRLSLSACENKGNPGVFIAVKNRVLDYFLSGYAEEDYIVRQKSRAFVIIAIATAAISLILVVPIMIFDELGTYIILAILSVAFFSLVSLYLTKRGLFKTASHTFMISLFMLIWITLFIDEGDLLRKFDTITFIFAFLTLTPLVITRRKFVVLVYTAVNIIIFIIFALYTGKELGLSSNSITGYTFDVIVALVFSGFISYFISSIYINALEVTRKSEAQLQQNNNDLASANRELEEMYEQVNFVSNEMVNINLQLSDEKEMLSTTLRSMDEAVITTDDMGAVVLMNRAAVLLTGWSNELSMGVSVNTVLPLYYENQNYGEGGLCVNIVDNGRINVSNLDNMYFVKENNIVHISGRCSPVLDSGGKLSGVVIILRDITNKKKMETELSKASKIETLGVFAGGIAHDLNNLLTSILGNISLAKYESDSESELFSILQSAEDASLKTKDLSLQLLSFTKCGEPVKEVTSARDLIVKSAKFALSGSRLDYILNLQDDLWNVKVDRSQINQVIYNIVLNAIQAQGKSGNISISAMNVSHNSDPDISGTENFVKIIIRDSGPGIPADVINSIFDPFFTTKREGSGLGLSIVYSIIKKHEGFINVTSIEGEGAIFEIFIPATDESLIDADVKTGHVLHRRGRVLIVDDDKKIIHVLSRMLTILGFAVDSVSDGESAVKFYRIAVSAGSAYDVVIMDLTMRGGIGGDEAARILKEYDPGAKIIVSSGYANDSIMANYRDYGFVDSLQKPYGMEDLKSVIGRVFQ